MSKRYSRSFGLGLVLGMLGCGLAQAQTVIPRRTCGTQEADALSQAALQRLNPHYNPAKATGTTPPSLARGAAVTYTVPVVVHIIHNGEAVGTTTNISQAQVQAQLDVLNEDYRNLNPDGPIVVPPVYQSKRGDAQVQFVLALRNPSGAVMAEPGIDRINRNTKGFTAPPYTQAYNESTIKPQTYWNPEQYINIWVENLGGGLLGYAQFPDNNANLGGLSASGGLASTDGVVILYSAFGSKTKNPTGTYTASYDQGRTLTHELGHWFSLRHIWGDSSCGTDYCADTPTQQAANYGCVTFPHVTCSNVTGDMSQNYMDYSDDRCMAMFSSDQVTRIQAVMASGTPRRANLVNSPALCLTSVAVTASSNATVCVGGSVSLTASGPTGATYSWTGPGGFTSTSQNPTLSNLTASQAGTYTVTAKVAGGAACPGSATTTVTVNTPPATPTITSSVTGTLCLGSSTTLTGQTPAPATLPSADFNSGLPTGWTITNGGTTGTQWQATTNTTYSYSGGFTLNSYSVNGSRFAIAVSDVGGSTSTTNTSLTTPTFSTLGYASLSLAFQQRLRLDSGFGAVEASTDGGTTWTAVATYSAAQGTNTTPAATTVNLSAYANQPSLQLRWHYIDAWGYFWAIDNVVLTGTAAAAPTYAWTLVSGDGLPATTNAAALTVAPTQNSVYRVTTSYPGSTCTASATVAVVVSSVAVPTPSLAASTPVVCAGGTTQLSATNLTGTGYTYAWTLVSGNGLPTTTNAATLTVSPTQNSVYRLTVSAAGANCSTTSTIAVQAVPTPTLAASTTAVCPGSSAQLSASNVTGTGYTYAWTLVSGDGLPGTTNAATLTVNPTQNSVYRLTVSYPGAGCTTTSTVTVQAIPTPALTTSATQVCGGNGTAQLSATNLTGTGYTYAWTLVSGNGLPAVTNTAGITVSPTQNSVYRLTVGYPGSTCTTTSTVAVQAATAPTLAATQTVLCRTGSSQLSVTNLSGSGYTYAWTVNSGGNGLPAVTNTATITVTPTQTSTYTLTVNGCATGSITVTVNTTGTGTGCAALASTPAAATSTVRAYPVPFGGEGLTLQVSAQAAGPLAVQVYDVMGRRVYDRSVASVPAGEVNVALPGTQHLPAGKYLVKVQLGGQNLTLGVVRY